MVLGYRREEEEETATEEEARQFNHNSLSSLARARRRVTDGVLPPLKSVGLPPIKHAVLPTVLDTEGSLQEEEESQPVIEEPQTLEPDTPEENGNKLENGGNDDNDVKSTPEDKEPSPVKKKSSRIARFFSGLSRKKSLTAVKTLAASEEEPEPEPDDDDVETNSTEHHRPLEQDTCIESLEDPVNDEEEESKRDVMEAFTENESTTTATVDGKPGHKQSKACVLL